MKSLFSFNKLKQLLLLISIIQFSYINSEEIKKEKNTGPLVHPVMAPASMSPLGGVSKYKYKKI